MSTLTTTAPATPLATAQHLADLSPDELANASRSLQEAEERYDRMSGICATLNGLVLLEAKRRLDHGHFTPWLKKNFPKSHQIATTRMRIANDFLGKMKPQFHFEAEQLLFTDFARLLEAEKESPLATDSPIVDAVAKFVDGRSFSQLRDALPMHMPGGKTYERDGNKGRRITATPEAALRALRTLCIDGAKQAKVIYEQRAFMALESDGELDGLINHFEEVAKLAKAWRDMTAAQRAEIFAEHLQTALA
jgi:hypothetical protein